MKRCFQFLISALLHLCALLPFRALYLLADITYIILYYMVRYRRSTVRGNLTASFPDSKPGEISLIERRFYRNFADYIFETVKLLHISDAEMSSRMTFENVALMDDYTRSGRSVCVYFSHCGNWEWAPSVTLHTAGRPGRDIVFGQVYRPLRDKWMDAFMLKLRGRFGSVSFPKSTVFRDIIRCKRDTGLPVVVGFMSDQRPSHGDLIHVIEFLNHPTAFITGTETLARKLDMGVVYWDMYKPSRGHYRIVVRNVSDSVASEAPFAVTDRYADMLQSTIRRDPSLWLWTHKRWKKPVKYSDNEPPRHS